MKHHEDSVIEEAISIARRDLRWCYQEQGIWTGTRHVFWGWDSFFASFGALELGDFAMVKTNLELYLGHQKKNGLLPKRIAHPLYWMRFIGLPIPEEFRYQGPTYANAYYTAPSIAQHPTLTIALHAYVMQSGDTQFFLDHAEQLEAAFRYMLTTTDRKGLVQEGIGGGWAESVLKRGAICFTNVCQARALCCMAELYQKVGNEEQAKKYEKKFAAAKKLIQTVFWSDKDGGYLSDWIGTLRYHHFATDGNVLALWWDLVTDEQAEKMEAKVNDLIEKSAIPIQLTEKELGIWRVHFSAWMFGHKNYHMRCAWSWLGSVDVLAKLRRKHTKEALAELHAISAAIVRDGSVHEVYNEERPLQSPFYHSEHPWAWGAGLFLKACAEAGFTVKGTE